MESEGTDAQRAVGLIADAATEWAATGQGQPLVDAAALGLVSGLDTPSLRVLAGAPAGSADEEATELAPTLFDELGLEVAQKYSDQAYVDFARLQAQRFLDGSVSARRLARDLWSLFEASRFHEELCGASGLDDWYSLLDDGVIDERESVVDAQVRAVAKELASGRQRGSASSAS